MTHIQNQILKHLKYNKNKHITGRTLTIMISFDTKGEIRLSPLQLRREIKEIRKQGYPIIAGKKGYCYTTDEKMFNEYIESRRAELKSEAIILNTMKGLW